MIRIRQKQSKEARKYKNQGDSVSFVGCTSAKHGAYCRLNKLHKGGNEVQSSSTIDESSCNDNGIWAQEWLSISHSRPVLVTLEDEDTSLKVFNKKGEVLSSIHFENASKLTIKLNKDVESCR